METPRPPTIVPMWIIGALLRPLSLNACTHAGFDKLIPEGRHAPWKYLPCHPRRCTVRPARRRARRSFLGQKRRCRRRYGSSRTGRCASRSRKSSGMPWRRFDGRTGAGATAATTTTIAEGDNSLLIRQIRAVDVY
ncbi:hypothetical protein EDB85DRAFT_1940120 [Lactarius pseudohatsudake]|nr:hypothetical protein EDB85DRAFT_1940120 [Lactarius pseudohatsudake]